jgi:hypothetical protein
MTYSLNEVRALATKAARGAGFSWGMAEEAGLSMRLLSSNGLPGPSAFASYLTALDTHSLDIGLCPLSVGVQFSDLPTLWKDVGVGALRSPLLLAPFLTPAATQTKMTICLRWDRGQAVVYPGSGIVGRGDLLTDHSNVEVDVLNDGSEAQNPKVMTRAEIEPTTLKVLETFAARTYAPATEESRRAGAGASETDND